MLRGQYKLSCIIFVFVGLPIAGCGVQEDRTIEFSPDGESVTFQHGRDGVFIHEEGDLKELAVPDEGVVARSTPLWSPDGTQVVFQTAQLRGENNDSEPTFQNWNDAAEGRLFAAAPAVYSCWVYDKGSNEEPRKLFTANVSHVGLVAANLVVRWSSDGTRLIFSDRTNEPKMELFEWDLAAGKRRKWDIPEAWEVVFDVNPNSGDVVAVLTRGVASATKVELHYLDAQGTLLWKKALTRQLSKIDPSSRINLLRQMKPVWSPDGERFAFILPPMSEANDEHQLQVCDAKKKSTTTWYQSLEGLSDIAWQPDGRRLGVLDGTGKLRVGSEPGNMTQAAGMEGLRRFPGWSFDGETVAFVQAVPAPHLQLEAEAVPHGAAFMWLLVAAPTIGDAVSLAEGETFKNVRPVFDGMRVTFPKWSPTRHELSLWVTFTPKYVSLAGMLLGGGLRPGDPAAKLDVETGKLEWMAVNAFEFVQIGHYYAMRGEYERASKWYEKARAETGPSEPPENLEEFRQVLSGRRNFAAYEALVLSALGRDREAAQRLAEFDTSFFPAVAPEEETQILSVASVIGGPGSLVRTFLREACLAEAALNLDLVEHSRQIFRSRLETAESDTERLAHLAVISQLLLAVDSKKEYLSFMTEEYFPVLEKSGFSFSPDSSNRPEIAMEPLIVMLSAVPLCYPQFFAGFGREDLQQLAAKWETSRKQATSDTGRTLLDCGLLAMYGTLGDRDHRQQVMARLEPSSAPIDVTRLDGELKLPSEELSSLQSLFGPVPGLAAPSDGAEQ